MIKFNYRLGVGLIPVEVSVAQIYNLTQDLSNQYDLSFWIKSGLSIPHVTLFQGIFKSEEEVIKKMENVDISSFNRTQSLLGLSVWAQKILFLDCKKSIDLSDLHKNIYNVLFPLCEKKSADPQKFVNITEGQQKSFDTTGYPFSLNEYLPHFTVAHFVTPGLINKFELSNFFEKSNLSKKIVFKKIVLYRVGDLGRCSDFIYEQNLN